MFRKRPWSTTSNNSNSGHHARTSSTASSVSSTNSGGGGGSGTSQPLKALALVVKRSNTAVAAFMEGVSGSASVSASSSSSSGGVVAGNVASNDNSTSSGASSKKPPSSPALTAAATPKPREHMSQQQQQQQQSSDRKGGNTSSSPLKSGTPTSGLLTDSHESPGTKQRNFFNKQRQKTIAKNRAISDIRRQSGSVAASSVAVADTDGYCSSRMAELNLLEAGNSNTLIGRTMHFETLRRAILGENNNKKEDTSAVVDDLDSSSRSSGSSSNNITTILVHGASGTGKTRLVKAFVDSLQEQEQQQQQQPQHVLHPTKQQQQPKTTTFFGVGKFDQYQHSSGDMITTAEPFEAILKAMTSIVEALLQCMTTCITGPEPAGSQQQQQQQQTTLRQCLLAMRDTMTRLLTPAQRLLLEDLIPVSVNLWKPSDMTEQLRARSSSGNNINKNNAFAAVLEDKSMEMLKSPGPSASQQPLDMHDDGEDDNDDDDDVDVDEWLSHTAPRITLALRSFLRALLQVQLPPLNDDVGHDDSSSNNNNTPHHTMRIVVFLDDLQWAEDSAIGLIADLLSTAATRSSCSTSSSIAGFFPSSSMLSMGSTCGGTRQSYSVNSSIKAIDGLFDHHDNTQQPQQEQYQQSFVLIGAYRDDDTKNVALSRDKSIVVPTPPMIRWLERQLIPHSRAASLGSQSSSQRPSSYLVRVHVDNLKFEETNELVSTKLRVPMSKTRELAEVVYRKTSGNPYFVERFLELLQHEKLIYYSLKTYSWEWDLSSITSETNVTENVVQLLQQQISRLPHEHQSVLKLAACLGFYFDVAILREIVLREGLLGEATTTKTRAKTWTSSISPEQALGVSLSSSSSSPSIQPKPFIPTGRPFARSINSERKKTIAAIVTVAEVGKDHVVPESLESASTEASSIKPPMLRKSNSLDDLDVSASGNGRVSRPSLLRLRTEGVNNIAFRRLRRSTDSTRHFRTLMTSRYESLTNVKDRTDNQAVCAAWLVSILGRAQKECLIERASDTQYKFSHDGVQKLLYEMTPEGHERDLLHLRIGRLVRDTYLVKLTEQGNATDNNLNDKKDVDHRLNINRSTRVVDSLLGPSNNVHDEVDAAAADDAVWTKHSTMLFVAVAQLNKAAQYILNRKERIGLVELNLEASYRAKEQSAFLAASRFLQHAVALIQDETGSGNVPLWETNYGLCLEVFLSSAEAEYSCGDFVKALITVDDIFTRGHTFSDTLRATFVKINSLGVQRQLQKAIDEGCKALAQLDEPIPRRGGTFSVMNELVRTKKSLKGMSSDDLMYLPKITDPLKRAAMRILNSIALFAWQASEESLLPVVYFRMMRLTLLHGQCQWTPFAYATFGMLLAAYGDSKTASDFGQLALDMVHTADSAIALPRTYLIVYTFIYHIRRPLHLCVEPLLMAHRVGLETGELEYGSLAVSSYASLYVICGLPLSNLSSDMRTITEQLNHFHQDVALTSILPWWQLALNLMGESENVLELSGEAIPDQESFLEAVVRSAAEPTFYLIRLALFYLFDELDLAIDVYTKLQEGHRKTISGTHFIDHLELLYSALLMFRLAQDKSSNKASKYKRQGKKHLQSLDKLVKEGAINCHVMLTFVRAEEATTSTGGSIIGNAPTSEERDKNVQHMFDSAISSLARSGFTHLQAVANERIGLYMMETGDVYRAETYLLQAMRSYTEWGAVAKVERLRKQHSDKLAKLGDFSSLDHPSGTVIKGRRRFSVLPPNKK